MNVPARTESPRVHTLDTTLAELLAVGWKGSTPRHKLDAFRWPFSARCKFAKIHKNVGTK